MTQPLHQHRLLANAGHQAIPLDVSIEITHHCNFRCQHCYIPDFSAPDLLSTDRVLQLLEELAEMGTLFLTLTGGEMFLRKDWLIIARRARQLGFALRLFTNGALISAKVADDIAALPAAVEVSLYAVDPVIFETITQRKGSFAKTIQGIERLRARDIEVLLKMPLMTHNFEQIEAVQAYAAEIGAGCQLSPTITAKKDGDPATLALRIPLEQLTQFYGGPFSGCHPTTGKGDIFGEGPLCAAASRYCNITSAGDVMACNILPGSDRNLRDFSFREIWEGSPWLNKIRSIRRRDLHTCNTCESLSYCGRCHAQAFVEDGDLYGPSTLAQERAKLLEALNPEPIDV